MIALESLKRLRMIDGILVLIFSSVWILFSLLIEPLVNPSLVYALSLFIGIFLMCFLVLLVRRVGVATLFMLLSSSASFFVSNLGVVNAEKVLVLTLAGILFEIVFLLLKMEFFNVTLDVVVGAGIAAASVPVLIALLLSLDTAVVMLRSLMNLTLFSFVLGVSAALFSFLCWLTVAHTKIVLRFEYEQ